MVKSSTGSVTLRLQMGAPSWDASQVNQEADLPGKKKLANFVSEERAFPEMASWKEGVVFHHILRLNGPPPARPRCLLPVAAHNFSRPFCFGTCFGVVGNVCLKEASSLPGTMPQSTARVLGTARRRAAISSLCQGQTSFSCQPGKR